MLNSLDFRIHGVDTFTINDMTKELNARFEECTLGEFSLKTCFTEATEGQVKLLKMNLQVFGDKDEVIKINK